MAHEWDTCSCVLCLALRRVYNLLYSEEASGSLQRKGVELLRSVHYQLLDFKEGGEVEAATSATPGLPSGGGGGTKRVKQEHPSEEKENADDPDKAKPVETPEEKGVNSPSKESPPDTGGGKASVDTGEGTSTARDSAPSKKERTRSSRDRERRRRRDKEEGETEGADKRSRSRHRRRQRRASSKAKSPEKGQAEHHSPSRKSRRKDSRDRESPHTPAPSPGHHSPQGSLPSRPSGLTNAQKRAIPPPPKPPPVRAPREPDHPPPGYSSWAETDVRSKSYAYRDPPPNKGKKKDERNHNFRLWREYERGYY